MKILFKETIPFENKDFFMFMGNKHNISEFEKIDDVYWHGTCGIANDGAIMIRIPDIENDFNEWDQDDTLIVALVTSK